MYFVSSTLVSQLAADAELQQHADETLSSANSSHNERFLPWEDVYTGMALTQAASGPALASVHMHMALYAEGWQFSSTPSVLLWHMKIKKPARIIEVERWSEQQEPCVTSAVRLTCANVYTSCNNQHWLRCMSLHNKSACVTKKAHMREDTPTSQLQPAKKRPKKEKGRTQL